MVDVKLPFIAYFPADLAANPCSPSLFVTLDSRMFVFQPIAIELNRKEQPVRDEIHEDEEEQNEVALVAARVERELGDQYD